jgi:hypothetical protein
VSSLQAQSPDPQQVPDCRNTALWYPRIPHRCLQFLGIPGRIIESDPEQDLPLCYEIFGGLNGELLGSLSAIAVRVPEDGDLLLDICVDFIGLECAARLGSQSVKATRRLPFLIDGSRGERITGMDTFVEYDTLSGFKVSLWCPLSVTL